MPSPFEIHSFNEKSFINVLTNKFLSENSIEKHNRVIYLQEYLGNILAESMLVENNYTDGDYLDDFASYYVRCHEDYSRRCKRIHFFSIPLEEKSFLNIVTCCADEQENKIFKDSYLGFIVVRPLPQAIIGRTVLKTYGNNDGRNYTCVRKYEVNLFGIDLIVEKSLAFQEQDTVIAACATVSLWCCFHKTADLFGTPAPRPADITRIANQVVHNSRSFPSNGLAVQQMCDAIGQVGLEPEVLNIKRVKNQENFPLIDLIYSYLRMGLPVILGSEIENRGFHAITLLGFSLKDDSKFPVKKNTVIPTVGSRIDKIYAHDDQNGPFSEIEIDKNHESGAKYPTVFKSVWNQLDKATKETLNPSVVIIPVYNKIRVTFLGIQKWINCLHPIIESFLISQGVSTDSLEWDIHLSTSNELKLCLKEENISEESRRKLFLWPHPRFIWRATLSDRSPNQEGCYQNNKIVGFFADATDIPHGFPIYQILWYEEIVRTGLNEYLSNHGNVDIILSDVQMAKDLDRYRKLIEFIKNKY